LDKCRNNENGFDRCKKNENQWWSEEMQDTQRWVRGVDFMHVNRSKG